MTSLQEQKDGLASKLRLATKPGLPFNESHSPDGHLFVLQFNCERFLMQFVQKSGGFNQEWWPQTKPSSSTSTTTTTKLFELDLNKLEKMTSLQIKPILKELKTHENCTPKHPFFTDVITDVVKMYDDAFDQYSGMRQVGDLRGLPEFGPKIFNIAKEVVSHLHTFTAAVLIFVFANIHERVVCQQGDMSILSKVNDNAKQLFEQFAEEHDKMLTAICNKVGCLRSKYSTNDKGETFNNMYTKIFVQDIIQAVSEYENTIEEQFNAVLATVEQCPESVRQRIYSEVGGRASCVQRCEEAVAGLRPWAVEWLQIQKDSFGKREVFAVSADVICKQLEQSKADAVRGFVECLRSGVARPVYELVALMDQLKDLVKKSRQIDNTPVKKKGLLRR